jgi:hypothetical protein
MSSRMELDVFRDYVHLKAFDVISGDGSYRRYLFECRDLQNEWAVHAQSNVSKVACHVRNIQGLVDRVRKMNTSVAKLCNEVVTAMHAPVKTVPHASQCFITGEISENCIDISRATKNCKESLVHPKFQYFALMLYYVHRLDHVVRCYAKCWLEKQNPDLTMAQLTEEFKSTQEPVIAEMHWCFIEGSAHVTESLQYYLMT